MNCTACERKTATGIHLCDTCADNLHDILNTMQELQDDLFDTMAKLDVIDNPGSPTGYDLTAPIKFSAYETKRELDERITSWATMLLEYDTRNQQPPSPEPIPYLRQAVNEIRKHDWSGAMLEELHDSTTKARRLIDRPKDIRILGKCWQTVEYDDGEHRECNSDIKADYHETTARCSYCGATYHVGILLAEIERKTRGNLMTAAQARKWLRRHAGVAITAKDIENWIYLKHIPYVLDHVSSIGKGRKLYYPGDVLKVHHRMQDRRRRTIRS